MLCINTTPCYQIITRLEELCIEVESELNCLSILWMKWLYRPLNRREANHHQCAVQDARSIREPPTLYKSRWHDQVAPLMLHTYYPSPHPNPNVLRKIIPYPYQKFPSAMLSLASFPLRIYPLSNPLLNTPSTQPPQLCLLSASIRVPFFPQYLQYFLRKRLLNCQKYPTQRNLILPLLFTLLQRLDILLFSFFGLAGAIPFLLLRTENCESLSFGLWEGWKGCGQCRQKKLN